MLAQGDILLIPVNDVPGNMQAIAQKELVVGYGESSGHSHVLEGTAVQWLVDACEDVNSLHQFALGNRTDNPELFVQVPEGGQLLHKANNMVITYDHQPIDVPPGTYRVVRQRMATAGTIRPVFD